LACCNFSMPFYKVFLISDYFVWQIEVTIINY
jgi:hypothetical protein